MDKKEKKSGFFKKGLDTAGKRLLVLTIAILMTFQFCTPTFSGVSFADEETTAQESAEAVETVTEEAQAEEQEAETPVQEETAAPEVGDASETVEPAAPEQPVAPAQEEAAAPQKTPAETSAADLALSTGPMSFEFKTPGGVRVNVSAEAGTFPAGTQMKVTEVPSEDVQGAVDSAMGGEATVLKAVDITFYNGTETDIQPAKPVKVKVTSAEFNEASDMAVVHVTDAEANDAEVVALDENRSTDTTAAFNADGFSVYAIVGTGTDARVLVKFMNGTSEIAQMYVKSGDDMEQVIYDPGAGTLGEGVLFEGWVDSNDYTVDTAGKSIDDVRSEVFGMLPPSSDGTEKVYYAKLVKQYNVSYLDENETCLATEALKVRANAENTTLDYTVNQAYVPDGDEDFEGWNVNEGGSNIEGYTEGKVYKNGDSVKISGSVIFSVKAPKGRWLVFHENKGTYIAPQFVKLGETTKEPTQEMQRNGYDFDGWYSDEELTTPFTFGNTISDTTHLYAKWTAKKTAGYTILIWRQNVNDAKDAADSAKTYDFAEAISGTGNVGEVINTAAGTSKKYEGFTLNSGKTQTDVKITPEGTAVANVYFDRNLITLKFMEYRSSGWSGGWQEYETMTGLYGSTLASNGYVWPTEYRWTSNTSGGTTTTFLDAFIVPGGDTSETYYGQSHSGNSRVHFMKQNANGSGYTEANVVRATGGPTSTFNISDKYNGFKAVSYSKNNSTWTTLGEKDQSTGYYAGVSNFTDLYIRYDRVEYGILYKDGVYVDRNGNPVEGYENRGELKTETGLAYGADLKDHNKGGAKAYTPTYDGFVFEGWYVDELCTQPYTFTTMPEGITVYAKWRQIYYRVFLRPNAGTDASLYWGSEDQSMNFLIANGGAISAPYGTRSEYEFVGWFLSDGSFFNEEAFVANDSIAEEYDKTVDMTDPMDKWGNGATSNNDVNRDWVIGKIELNGKWRATLTGANGIGIIYNANESDDVTGKNAPTDKTLYVDSAKAIAGAASTPDDGTQKFEYWVLQTWDESSNSYKDTETKVFPGEDFDVFKANAKIVENEGSTPEEPSFTYTVQLRAEYGPKDKPTPTHIYWYKNTGEDAFIKNENVDINVGRDIPAAPERTGYKFLGWSRVGIGQTQEEATTWEKTEANWTQDLDEGDLYLTYTDGKYTIADGTEVKQVAPDENLPYHAMFAVWEVNTHKVTYEYTGTVPEGAPTAPAEQTAVEYGTTVTVANAPTMEGYTFSGWTTTDATVTSGTFTMPDKDVKLTGSWTINSHKVTYEYTGTVPEGAPAVPAEAAYEYGATVPAATVPTMTGYTFSGWTGEVTTMPDNDVTVTGSWSTNVDVIVTGSNKNVDYNGDTQSNKEYTVSYKVGGVETQTLPEGITQSVVLAPEEGASGKNAGEYSGKVTVTLALAEGTTGYTLTTAEGSGDLGLVIKPLEITIKADDKEKTYGDADPEFTYSVVSGKLIGEDKLEGITLTRDDGEDVGNYTIKINLPAPAPKSGIKRLFGGLLKAEAPAVQVGNYMVKTENGTLKIDPAELKVTTGSDSKVYDGTPLTKDEAKAEGLKFEDAVTVKATGAQTYVGTSDNTYSLDWGKTKKENYTVKETLGTLTVTDDKVDPDKVITKTHEDKEYKVGDTVTFTIKATNIYDKPQTITFSEQEGVKITGKTEFKDVEPGKTVETTATYVVTKEDAAKGEFKNTATAKFSNGKEYKGEDTVKNLVPEKEEPPKTGDTTPIVEYTLILSAAVTLLLMLLFRRRKAN